jgi:hypothetical protein
MPRQISDLRTVTHVEPEAGDSLTPIIADFGEKIIAQSQQAKIVENSSAAQLELGKLANDFQTQYEGDPFSQQGLKDYKASRQEVLDRYGGQISPMFKRAWDDSALKITDNNDTQLQAWGFKQAAVNTKASLQQGMQNNLQQAAIDGEAFGKSDAEGLGSLMNFVTAKQKLDEFGNTHLGATSTEAITKDFSEDYTKVWLSGVGHANPVKALKLMDDPKVQAAFSKPEEFQKFREAIETRALNVAEVQKKQEVLDVLKSENDLFSGNKALSYAEIQQATHSMSEPARDYFLKANGYKKDGDTPLKLDQKLQYKATLYDQITQLSTPDKDVKPEDLQALQGAIYTGMRKGALTEQEGANFLTQLVAPVITQKEGDMSKFSSGQWNPFKENVGFAELQGFYADKVEIKPAEGEKQVHAVSAALNATNKANLYDNYWNALQVEAAKNNVTVADIPNLTNKDAIYAKAQAAAQNKFLAAKSPVLKVQPSIPITAIKKLMEHPEKAGDFDEMFGTGAANRVLGK